MSSAYVNLKPLGQESAWKQLLQFQAKLPQALLLLGPSGVGKRLAAKAYFQIVHCQSPHHQEPCGLCISCQKIARGNHPDLHEISPQGEQIVVDDLRELKTKLYFKPVEGVFRLVVIDQAHRMNATSANSLLKTLEEPPTHTRFMLITHEKSLLLPTILSRCQYLHFAPLPLEIRQTILQRVLRERNLGPSPEIEAMVLGLLGDGLDRLDRLATEEALEFIENMHRYLKAGAVSLKWPDIVGLADQLSTEDEWKLELFLDMLLLSVEQKTKNALESQDLPLAQHLATRALETTKLRRRLGRYANKRLVALSSALNAGDNP